MKLCFIAPSGYGKTTASNYITSKYGATNIKIASFLYDIQEFIYTKMGVDIKGKQDGELLQFLGMKVRKIDPNFLLKDFERKVNILNGNLIINDDCRPIDYEKLKQMGFIFIGIKGFSHDRSDITKIDKKNALEWQSEIMCDFYLDNTSTLEDYYRNIDELLGVIFKDGQVLHYTNSKSVQC